MGMVRALKDLGIMKALVMKVDMGMVMEMEAVAASENFFRGAFLKKHKLHNLIKKKLYNDDDDNNNNKKNM